MFSKESLEVLVPLLILLIPLVLTILIEGAVALVMGLRGAKAFLALLFVNVITNPVANILLLAYGQRYAFRSHYNFPAIIGIELAVFIIEALLFVYALRMQMKRAFSLSFFMNIVSFAIGAGIWWYLMNFAKWF